MQDFEVACVQTQTGQLITPQYVEKVLSSSGSVADLVVLPEIGNVPYFPLETGSASAQDYVGLDGEEIKAYRAVARKFERYLMLGVYLGEDKHRYNAALLLGPQGEIVEGRTASGDSLTVFKKIHLCDVSLPSALFCESEYFSEGKQYIVWELPFARIGTLICYDRHFPEAWITLRMMGAEVVCVCTTSPASAEPYFIAEMQAMALQQSVYAAVSNRSGDERLPTSGRLTRFLGSSVIVGPYGDIIAAAEPYAETSLISAQLKAEPLSRIRAGHKFHERRRPDTYLNHSTL
jgi:N-carbamoylputrescine amidase